ncbi:hypothetical protein ACROYT_G022426 [Oculina patagonica]
MCVIVADIEDEGILGMDFLSQVDSQIDIVKNQVSINGEVFDCSDFKNQPLSSRCMVRRSTIIEPHTEVVVPVTVHKRSATLNPKASQLGMRLLEPCLSSHLQQKGLYVARTLVDVREDRVVPLCVFNVSDEVYNLAAETVVALATPVMDVTLLELTEENHGDLGTTHLAQHRIETGNVPPIRQQPRRTSPWKHGEIERQVADLLQKGKVKESSSPWSSPVVLEKAAFVIPSGLYEWNVMPFGLCNAPSTFARLMELVLKGLHWKICLIYLDDVIVMGRTFEEELERLKQVFERLACAGLKLKPKKCFLFQKRVSYLGHVVTEEGITADLGKVEQVRTWPIPENSTEVKSFLGLASYYRRFIPNFAAVAQPLHKLTEAKTEFVWTGQC